MLSYSTMLADGKDLKQIDKELTQIEQKAKPKPKLDEDAAGLEYSLALAGNDNEDPKFTKYKIDRESETNV